MLQRAVQRGPAWGGLVGRRSFGGGPVHGGARRLISSARPLLASSGGAQLTDEEKELLATPREAMEFDVVVVGGGPAGLATAIRLKQLEAEHGREISVCVLEKAAELGAHTLSGNCFIPRALTELEPDWKAQGALGEDPTEAKEDRFVHLLNEKSSISVPGFLIPGELHNEGNYIISLSQLVRWLGSRAEEMGVEIYPGFPAAEVLYDASGNKVVGVATRDMGIDKEGRPKDTFMRGMELRARQTVFAEGCRGSCSEEIIAKYDLRASAMDNQSYGLGVKEVWEVPEANHRPGLIQHTTGWPLDSSTYGGSFLYHMKPNLVHLGFVVGLGYENPTLSPYQELQRWKHHPEVAKHLEGGKCIEYGARALNEGGFQAIPKLTFPGGALVGDSAGFLNVMAIKGSHTSMKSGMLAAEALYDALGQQPEGSEEILEVTDYEDRLKKSWVHDELYRTRNSAPAFKYGNYVGMLLNGLFGLITRGKEPFTLTKHSSKSARDADHTKPIKDVTPIEYPKPDGKLSFDLLTNLQRSGTNHDDDQPAHLTIKPTHANAPAESLAKYGGPEQYFCPARVYEYVGEGDEKELVINAQNCVHCKTCDIKATDEFIRWTCVPRFLLPPHIFPSLSLFVCLAFVALLDTTATPDDHHTQVSRGWWRASVQQHVKLEILDTQKGKSG